MLLLLVQILWKNRETAGTTLPIKILLDDTMYTNICTNSVVKKNKLFTSKVKKNLIFFGVNESTFLLFGVR